MNSTAGVCDLKLKVTPGSLRRSAKYVIVGEIWYDFGDESFPHSRWSDFSVVVLGWWLESLATMIEGRKRNVEMLFMDGSFKVALFAKQRYVWVAQLSGTRLSGERVDRELEVRADVLIDSALKASEVVLAECASKKWASSDIESLRLRREQLLQCRGTNRWRNE